MFYGMNLTKISDIAQPHIKNLSACQQPWFNGAWVFAVAFVGTTGDEHLNKITPAVTSIKLLAFCTHINNTSINTPFAEDTLSTQ